MYDSRGPSGFMKNLDSYSTAVILIKPAILAGTDTKPAVLERVAATPNSVW